MHLAAISLTDFDMDGPNPDIKHPIPMHTRVGFLKGLVNAPNIEIGDFTYYDDPDGPDKFAEKCVLHHYPFIGDKLIIGRFCAIAEGARFIMNGANHAMSGFSTIRSIFSAMAGKRVLTRRPGRRRCAATPSSATTSGSAWRR